MMIQTDNTSKGVRRGYHDIDRIGIRRTIDILDGDPVTEIEQQTTRKETK
jgi:hypothetical protein